MTNRFDVRKQHILEQLAAPDGEYQDLSPKGSVDEPILDLIGELNNIEGLVTTSSCSGRISVFLEGNKAVEEDVITQSRAGPGGKGGGGTWLYISHSPIEELHHTSAIAYTSLLGLEQTGTQAESEPTMQSRYIHLKFEPMILHILTASTSHAHRVLTAASSAGFRESGAMSFSAPKVGKSTPMVAVRSTGYSFDAIVGYLDASGRHVPLVDEQYLQVMVGVANERFKINRERTARFRSALQDIFHPSTTTSSPDWEDADARRRRKREEGLARQQALLSKGSKVDNIDIQLDGSDAIDGAVPEQS